MFEVHTVRDRVEGVGRVGGLKRETVGWGGGCMLRRCRWERVGWV